MVILIALFSMMLYAINTMQFVCLGIPKVTTETEEACVCILTGISMYNLEVYVCMCTIEVCNFFITIIIGT